MAATKITAYKRFQKALETYVRACTDIVTLVGHATADLRIIVSSGKDELTQPCVMMTISHRGDLVPDAPNSLKITSVIVEAFAEEDDADRTLDVISALEKYIAATPSFNYESIKTIGIYSIGPVQSREPASDESDAVYVSSLEIEIRWKDLATS